MSGHLNDTRRPDVHARPHAQLSMMDYIMGHNAGALWDELTKHGP